MSAFLEKIIPDLDTTQDNAEDQGGQQNLFGLLIRYSLTKVDVLNYSILSIYFMAILLNSFSLISAMVSHKKFSFTIR